MQTVCQTLALHPTTTQVLLPRQPPLFSSFTVLVLAMDPQLIRRVVKVEIRNTAVNHDIRKIFSECGDM
jgi:hypothetical protein